MQQPSSLSNNLTTEPNSIGAALLEGATRLKHCQVLRPRRHAELLLESALGIERTELYIRAREPLSDTAREHYETLLRHREGGEPVQHIVGWAPFYGRRFLVGKGVFIPRFETELLVERLLTRWREEPPPDEPVELLDLCCGCGAVGLTVAAELPQTRVTLTDNSEIALEYSARNALALQVNDRVDIVLWDALNDPPHEWQGRFHYILANPPYIPAADLPGLPRDVREGEPRDAITDNADGLSFYRRWVETLPLVMQPGGCLFVECGDGAAGRMKEIITAAFSDIKTTKDLNGMDRMAEGIRL